jgi:hypothetical protein
MKRTKSFLLMGILFAFPTVTVISCGGGGGGSSSGSQTNTNSGLNSQTSSGATTGTKAYLPYKGSLHLVDPDNPKNILELTSKKLNDAFVTGILGNYDYQSKTYKDLHLYEVYFVEKSNSNSAVGVLKKASLLKSDSLPSSQEISNLNNVCNIWAIYYDEVSPKTYMKLKTAGADGVCYTDDDEFYFVNSQMSASDNPISLKNREIVTELSLSASNPTISGFLVWDKSNQSLLKCDTNLTNCKNLKTGIDEVYWVASDPNNNEYLCINGILNKYSNGNLNNLGVNCIARDKYAYDYDSKFIYAIDNSFNIYNLSFDNPEAGWQLIYNNGDADFIVSETKNYIIIESITNVLKAIKKDGSSTLEVYKSQSNEGIDIVMDDGNNLRYIFFNVEQTDNNGNLINTKACIWDEQNDSVKCTDKAYWVGASFAVNGKFNLDSDWYYTVSKMLKAENVTNPSNGGGTLYAVDPTNPDSKIKLGNIPAGYTLWGEGLENGMLLYGLDNSAQQSDIFYVNPSKENSLLQITNTKDKNEYPIY